jgi:hypothetical protein
MHSARWSSKSAFERCREWRKLYAQTLKKRLAPSALHGAPKAEAHEAADELSGLEMLWRN